MLWQPTRGLLQPNQHWRRPSGGGGFDPLTLAPHVYLRARPEYLYADAAHTTPVAGDDDPVGAAANLGSYGGYATQSTAGSRPAYNTDGTLHWLQGDASADYLSMAAEVANANLYVAMAIMPGDAAEYECVAAVAPTGQSSSERNDSANLVSRDGFSGTWRAYNNGPGGTASLTNGTAYVIESIWAKGSNSHILSVNGTDNAGSSAGGDFATDLLFLLCESGSGGTPGRFSGVRLYSLFLRVGALPTSGERALLRTALGAHAGLTL